MKKPLVVILLLLARSITASADHITGGEMYYSYTGFSNGLHHYVVTYKLFMRCGSGRSFLDPAVISVFNKSDLSRVSDLTVPLSYQTNISLPNPGPCITNPPQVCYDVGYYEFTVSVPPSVNGYIVASQVNYRISGISNLQFTPGFVGATYSCEIPGITPAATGPVNRSAFFTGSDLVVVCANNFFSYSFAARDDDGDQLAYSFCSAYNSSVTTTNGTAAGTPPFPVLTYNEPGFNPSFPLGSDVQINPATGLISGIAPSVGVYVVTVCVQESRNGSVIATQRKDIQINIADCDIASATLDNEYMLCKGGNSISLTNLSQSPLINRQDWTVIDPSDIPIFTSSANTLNYSFTTPGIYTIRLAVNRGEQCSDSTTSNVYYFPGFVPNFDFTGICVNKPTTFTDLTTTVTGSVNSWKWDFGEPTAVDDIATTASASYTYPGLGSRTARLIVTNTDGCRDTVSKVISIIDKPPITLAFRDTLICAGDQLTLQASGMGTFSWTPNTAITNANTPNPVASPNATMMYYVDLDSDGCLNRDSVRVRVVDHVTLQMFADTTICSGDSIRLRIESDGLRFSWTPAVQLVNPSEKDPVAITPSSTQYTVTATVGGCSASGTVRVITVPYPLADAGGDITICHNTSAGLQGSTDGTSWSWSPPGSLSDASVLNPQASPMTTTAYVLTAFENTRGCPKPSRDTVIVRVLPPIPAFAGNDTAVIIGQQLQLQASGGSRYEWSPALHLSASNIHDPTALFPDASIGHRYKVTVFNPEGCEDSAFITVKVFATLPTVFVPTAFTPNNDGKNDFLQPVVAGMKHVDYFNIYNRWGQLVYSGNGQGAGWDGRVNGEWQGTNTYVWVVKAVNYLGEPYFRKGHVTLIR